MPGYSDYTAMKTDPVARRRYSPRHVGFARGGEVEDPMDYVPDRPQEQRPMQRGGFDEFNMIGREDPKVNPMLAGETGYAKAGLSLRLRFRLTPIRFIQRPVQPTPSSTPIWMQCARARLIRLRCRCLRSIFLRHQRPVSKVRCRNAARW